MRSVLCSLSLLIVAGLLISAPVGYAAPPEGKGKDSAPGQQKKEDSPPGQARAAEARAESRERAEEAKLERQHPHQDRQALNSLDHVTSPGRTHLTAALAHIPGEHGIRSHGAGKGHLDELLKSLTKFDHARWSYNPHDTRGQGNMGKVDMRDPYGFDKDSGREKSERGRSIHIREPEILDLASLLTFMWGMIDYYAAMYLDYLRLYYYSSGLYATSPEASWAISYFENIIAYYNSLPYVSVASNTDDTINYTLSLGDVPTSFEGDTVVVTTTLTSINNYSYFYWTYDTVTKSWVYHQVHYDAGEAALTQTQELTLSDNGTFTFSYDPLTTMVNYIGGYFELAVAVTDPIGGSTYTTTYDKQIYLFRCPYGIVYDRATGKPIAGAVVTIHHADSSIVALDKAANPNVSNPQTTDATGRYNAKLAIGKKYYLTVKAPGYADYKSPLFSERGPIVREDVGMTRLRVVPPATTPTAVPHPSPLTPLGR